MELRFTSTVWLLLLVPAVVYVWAMGWRLATLGKARRLTVLLLRTLLFACLILALAGMEASRTNDDLAVMFAVDASDSIPQELREYSLVFVQKALEQMGRKDRAGILLFGGDASIERNPQPQDPQGKLEKFESVPDRTQTNIADAVRLAMAALPADAKKRIVVLSDGNETTGQAEEAARAAAANHIALDVVPLRYQYRNDVILDKVVVENQVSVNEPFDVSVYVESPADTKGKLHIFRDRQLVATQDVTLEGGKKNRFVLPEQVKDSGFHTYSAQIEVPGDVNPENNTAGSFTMAQGEPRVLYVEGGPLEENRLVAMLRAEQVQCDLIPPENFPHDPAELQSYNSIVFSNVPASAVTRGQMQLIERVVHDLGIGFIMIGGEQGFGAGGWQDTPVEEALPVSMEIKHKKVLPQGALVLVLHTMEIPEGEYWGREIAIAALNVLSSRDLFGALAYIYPGGEQWLVPLQPAEDKAAMRRAIHGANNGDMPTFQPTMQMAYDKLKACNASVKHIVIISDGDPAPPSPSLLQAMRDAKITVSTVHIAGHGPADQSTMKKVADEGGGRYYQVANNQELPQIFVKEAAVVRKSLIFEEPFKPIVQSESEALVGIGRDEYPILRGYVGSEPKDLADVPLITDKKDPLLAHWRYGMGKTAAFTSDARMRWAAEWFSWNKMAKFWSQIVRWSLRAQSSRNLQMTTTIDQGQGKVVVDAVDDEGKFLNFLNYTARVITPEYKSDPLEFRQTGPGRYEATFPVNQVGSYLVSAEAKGEGGFDDLISGGTSLAYSPEFQSRASNDALLRKLREIGHGRELGETSFVFDHNLPSGAAPRPLWPALTAMALLLLLMDIFMRRVLVDWAMVKAGLAAAGRWIASWRPRRRVVEREERMEALLGAKRQAIETKEAETVRGALPDRGDLLEQLDRIEPEEDLAAAASEPSSAGSKAPREKPSAAAADEKKPEGDSFTSKLLEAKKRAKR
ncbi:MAG: VWA domain-containing protein [Candidatus Sumerlaeota bacterium]|nr:VWA domain-containing protein [Candidatus Sumerlaeota bacterium]